MTPDEMQRLRTTLALLASDGFLSSADYVTLVRAIQQRDYSVSDALLFYVLAVAFALVLGAMILWQAW